MIGEEAELPGRRRGGRSSFAAQVLVLQLVVVIAVVAVCTGVFAWMSSERLVHEAQSTALAIAQSVASDPDVRTAVTLEARTPGTPAAADLRTGPLQELGSEVSARTGALFVVITDERGIRLAHPDPDQLGLRVSTSAEAALAGTESVSWETGTLGPSARAKVPVFAAESSDTGGAVVSSGAGEVVGEISVGFAPQRVFADVVGETLLVAGAALLALTIGLIASMLIRRRLRRLTLGVGPEELAALVQNQAAVLGGVGEGVLGVSPDGIVTVCTDQAARLLDIGAVVGRRFGDPDLPERLVDLVVDDSATPTSAQLVVGSRVLFVDVRPVSRDGVDLGRVVVVRDRTDVEALTRRLDAVATMTTALRAQRHEFANRLHAISGLLETGQDAEARDYLANVLDHGPLKYPVQHADRLTEPYLQAFLGAKGVEAAERGVLVTIGSETLVTGSLCDPEDVTTVLGNLLDNAVNAAVAGRVRPAWVEVEVLDHGTELHCSVMDSGDGVAATGQDDAPPAAPTIDHGDLDDVHGHGFGLPLSRDIARRRGGDVWLASPGVRGEHGAVFCARLPGTVEPAPSMAGDR
ncbi:Spo0B domain-containing protein [Plantibacter sp. VKM Ac-2885]|uniref:sensor histidine kinase n=1 Tax=Plantibacter sp. VKM Ac-2885 TaxID=2783828 RepID=UPI00188A3041|nr:ATP-binding protein [Plantibacter sp. VKM Ac-2885]MBF4512342.1 Spo0B domain-containing protein [Plantibacter sp. VKM Ac-2885]